jgi:hypothetical protein
MDNQGKNDRLKEKDKKSKPNKLKTQNATME